MVTFGQVTRYKITSIAAWISVKFEKILKVPNNVPVVHIIQNAERKPINEVLFIYFFESIENFGLSVFKSFMICVPNADITGARLASG